MKLQMMRFALAGLAGYIVDTLVLYGVMALGMGFLRGRLVSFVCAVLATFILNRRYTFAEQLQASGQRPPLWLEFGRYLAAMVVGGFLNLATYWLVLRITPHFPALYALAIAAGSLVGMVANFASAKWWVFIHRPERAREAGRPFFNLTTAGCLVLAQVVFWTSHLAEVELPGLYMDAVNPDYLAARTLNPELPNPVWIQPTPGLAVLGALYHGVQTYYVGLPVFALLGFNMLALRVAQGLFAGGILAMIQLVLQRASGSAALGLAGALGVATELAFIASFRTQMYIVMAGAFWLLLALYLALERRFPAGAPESARPVARMAGRAWAALPATRWFFSGLCAGLAVYGYFVFLFFLPVFVVLGWWHTRDWRAPSIWLAGFVLGMQTYVLGYVLAVIELGGLGLAYEWIKNSSAGLAPMASDLTLLERVVNTWNVLVITLQSSGNELMIFQTLAPAAWAKWKAWLLAAAPLLLIAARACAAWTARMRAERELRADGLLASWHVALLPLAFLALSLVFGDRLWSHHFSALIPLSYVVLLLALHHLQRALRVAMPAWAGVLLLAAVIVGNVQQQQVFFGRLVANGGHGYFSNALNRLADDALSMPADVVHAFPEWGFGMPFAFLTGNRVAYTDDISGPNLQRLAAAGNTLRLYYWQPEAESDYRDALRTQGYEVGASGTYLQRDRNIAFYWLEALPRAAQ